MKVTTYLPTYGYLPYIGNQVGYGCGVVWCGVACVHICDVCDCVSCVRTYSEKVI